MRSIVGNKKNRGFVKNRVCGILSVLICGLSLLALCTGSSYAGKSTFSGEAKACDFGYREYVLSEIPELRFVLALKEFADTCVLLGKTADGMLVVYQSADGGVSWNPDNRIDGAALAKQLPEGALITAADMDAAGNVIFGYEILDEANDVCESKLMLFQQAEKELAEVVDFGLERLSRLKYGDFDINGAGEEVEYFYSYVGASVTRYNISGIEEYSIHMPELMDFCETETTVLLLTEQSLSVYDRDTGKLLRQDTYLNKVLSDELSETYALLNQEVLNCKNILKYERGGILYLMLASGIYSYVTEDAVLIHIVGDRDNGFESGGYLYDYIIHCSQDSLLKDTEIYLAIYAADTQVKSVLYCAKGYKRDTKQPERPAQLHTGNTRTSLIVFSLQYEACIEEMIDLYEKEHSDVSVEYRYGMDMEGKLSVSDAVGMLETELTAGGGPDVIIMDGLDVQSYAEAGWLMELSDVYDAILEENPNCLETVMSAYRTEEGIYAIPSKVAIPILIAPETDIDTITDIESLTEYIKASDPPCQGNDLNIYHWEELFDILYPIYSLKIFDAEGTYHEEEMEAFLLEFQELWNVLQERTPERPEDIDKFPNIETYMFRLIYREYTGQKIALGNVQCTQSMEIFYDVKHSELSDNEDYTYQIFSEDRQNVYTPFLVFSINANSRNPKDAIDFVKMMFGVNIQKGDYTGYAQGIPVNLDAIHISNKDEDQLGGAIDTGERYYWLDYYFVNEKDMKDYINFLQILRMPIDNNLQTESIVKEAMAGYMNDTMSLKDTLYVIDELVKQH